ncbi:MAG: hypothetical protein AAF401_15940 [Pseudomonadota bacterium]
MSKRVGYGDTEGTAAEREGPKGVGRIILIALLVAWIVACTYLIFTTLTKILTAGAAGAELVLFIWVVGAAIFWLVAARALMKTLRGERLGRAGRRGGRHESDRHWSPSGEDAGMGGDD